MAERRHRAAALGAAVALALTGCGGPEVDATVTLVEDAIAAPSTIPAGTWTIDVVNQGDAHHNLTVCRSDSVDECTAAVIPSTMVRLPPQARDPGFYNDVNDGLTLGKGWDATISLDLEPGTYRLWCAIIGHASAGMQTTLTVTEAP